MNSEHAHRAIDLLQSVDTEHYQEHRIETAKVEALLAIADELQGVQSELAETRATLQSMNHNL